MAEIEGITEKSVLVWQAVQLAPTDIGICATGITEDLKLVVLWQAPQFISVCM
jgi:hypothetical protein